ncbi:MAG: glycosyltransferase [Candidatus Levyibacteriota bacterium]
MKRVTIVLPTYNEKDNIEKFIKKIFLEAKKLPQYSFFIIVADSHSTDGTDAIVQKLSKKYKNIYLISVGMGLGVGLYRGHEYAIKYLHPDILIQLDADGQVDESIIALLLQTIEEGYSLALGSRFIKGGTNQLSFSRRLFSKGSSFICRSIMGPWGIKEFTNSARAFTPKLFKKINWKRLPWQEQTFIMQPAFLHEAILAGATYKEVPLVFKDRAKGYSKNKTFQYTRDVFSYAVDARLHMMGLQIPFFQIMRKI